MIKSVRKGLTDCGITIKYVSPTQIQIEFDKVVNFVYIDGNIPVNFDDNFWYSINKGDRKTVKILFDEMIENTEEKSNAQSNYAFRNFVAQYSRKIKSVSSDKLEITAYCLTQ